MSGGEECHEEGWKGVQSGQGSPLNETWIPLGQSNVGFLKSSWVMEGGRA